MRARATVFATAGALILSSLLTGPAVAATAVETTPSAAATASVRVTPAGRGIDAVWSTGYVAGTATTLRVTLPAEIGSLDLPALTWTLDDAATTTSGTVTAGARTFDVPLREGPAISSPIELTITGRDEKTSNFVRLSVFLYPSVPGAGSPVSTIAPVDLSLARASSGGTMHRYGSDPSPAAIVSDGRLTVAADRGFFTDGPDGIWSTTGGPAMIATLFDRVSGGEYSVGYSASADGAALELTLPEDLSGFTTGWIWITAGPAITTGTGGRAEITIPVVIDGTIATQRIDGADRYTVSAAVSKAGNPAGSDVAYLVSGTGFADALSAGPIAAAERGPVLLTTRDALPAVVDAELRRLDPTRIVVVGGTASVSEAVQRAVSALAPTVRISGADRYDVSRALAAEAYPDGAASVYVATGANFPDALSAGAAAGAAGVPVLLVRGGAASLDPESRAALAALAPQDIRIAGGPASVSEGVAAALGEIAPVTRYGGADRYAASVSLNQAAFSTSDRAFLVTGRTFPDALTGSALAGAEGAPLYTSRPDCVPPATLAAMRLQGVREVTLIGGPASLSKAVLALRPC
ncbi:cell wall-binding repeat-containing protein [Herbiconiux sp. CPCC 203407]|uniref:Cell wall-binding repeat-containing protein n=1 Tax=Herbiconiux oxytropis TaxID=2970915 RepID=A0AA42BSX9_9MICO|nr:cell wall-binding repeat-containing protein [Herbiconiux oxytropis]MCS5724182.1 cell wall-binding repeat-containing protein [Herbiconiux oxytropis]MCS5725780.1 cell wall-binding repeat-containing protein [Herbiconiux oxytropis]